MNSVGMFFGIFIIIVITLMYTINEGIKADEKNDIKYYKTWVQDFVLF